MSAPHPQIAAFLANVPSVIPANGVVGYVIGDTWRGPADQWAAYTATPRTSNARYGESAHSRGIVGEWQGAAVDVFPILENGSVSNDPAHYRPYAELAAVHGLQNLGEMYGSDWSHNQVPGHKSLPTLPIDESAWRQVGNGWEPITGGGLLATNAGTGALLVGLGALLWMIDK